MVTRLSLQTRMLTAIKELNTPRYDIEHYDAVKGYPVWGAKELEVDWNKVGLDASPTNVSVPLHPRRRGRAL